MLQKSKLSALILSTITTVTYVVTEIVISLAIAYQKTGEVPAIQNWFNTPLPFYWMIAIAAIFLIIFIIIGGFVIYKVFDTGLYYGAGGAFRWGLFGFLYAVSQQTYRYIQSSLPWYLKALDLVWAIMAWAIAFILIPTLFSTKDNEHAGNNRNL